MEARSQLFQPKADQPLAGYAILSINMKPLNKEWLNVGLGIIIFLLPLLGFPRGFNTVVYMLVGFVVAVSALRGLRLIYRREREEKQTQKAILHKF